jgi:hypothetical protein
LETTKSLKTEMIDEIIKTDKIDNILKVSIENSKNI